MTAAQLSEIRRTITLALALHTDVAQAFQRRLLVLAGDNAWCRRQAQALWRQIPAHMPLWIGESSPKGTKGLTNAQAFSLLGAETELLVYDAYSGFDPDAFGAVSGALQGGGLLILLSPPLDTWSDYPDPENRRIAVAGIPVSQVKGRFLSRLADSIRNDADAVCIEQDRPIPTWTPDRLNAYHQEPFDSRCRTRDQAAAVAAVMHVAQGHRKRPVVLISDRGRGKSSALGIAAAELLKAGKKAIWVTAPRQQASQALFAQASRLLPRAHRSKGSIHLGDASIGYSAPDHLLLQPRPADLLLVDEAAAIPTPILEALLEHYPRLAFATTIHGYEGSGRGFSLRFRQILDRRFPQWREIHLQQPIRWAPEDPLERWLFKALALDAAPAPEGLIADARPEACSLEILDRDRLIGNETDLTDLFGLLVMAHYRTTPLDLRHLLDGPNLILYGLRYRQRILATALVATEGGFDTETAHAIWGGYRRPRGHLLAQSLAAHLGLESAACLRGARIMRIAVHPGTQRRGLGGRLVQAIRRHTSDAGLDYLGVSFGATRALVRFWSRNRLLPIRIGLRRGASSGAQSVIMLHPLSAVGERMFHDARLRFGRQLASLLAGPLNTLDAGLACELLARTLVTPTGPIEEPQWLDLIGYGFARRGYENCLSALTSLSLKSLTESPPASPHAELLVMKIVQNRSWQVCSERFHLTGRSEVEDRLREIIGRLVLQFADPATRETALRIRAERPE
jgi:tRNA(Met) cytidine acetyltransferase